MTHWQRTELWVVLQLDSSSALTKLVRLIDGVELERLVTKMGRSGVKDCSASDATSSWPFGQ